MPNRRFDWHERVQAVEREYEATRRAVDRFTIQLNESPDLLPKGDPTRANLRRADSNLSGTYVVRIFAVFEAALRSYDRFRHNNPNRNENASTLIDSTAGRRAQGISQAVRDGAHEVRSVRNYWAHENEEVPSPMLTMAESRARLQKYLSWLPEEWD